MSKRRYGINSVAKWLQETRYPDIPLEELLKDVQAWNQGAGMEIVNLGSQTEVHEVGMEYLLYREAKRHRKFPLPDSQRMYPKVGSPATIAQASKLLPVVVQARMDLFGKVEPLSMEQATNWIKHASKNGEQKQKISFYLEADIPREQTSRLHTAVLMGNPLDSRRLFELLLAEGAQPRDIFPPIPAIRLGDQRYRVFTQTLRQLLEWTKKLQDITPISTDEATELILVGVIPRMGLESSITSSSGETSVSLTIRALSEASPQAIEAFVRGLKRQYATRKTGSGQGRTLDRETEVLALVALDLVYVKKVPPVGQGFYTQVVERFYQEALSYGVKPKRKWNRESCRKALERLRKAGVLDWKIDTSSDTSRG